MKETQAIRVFTQIWQCWHQNLCGKNQQHMLLKARIELDTPRWSFTELENLRDTVRELLI